MTREIPLTQGFIALVDDEDYDAVMSAGSWHVHRVACTYARRNFYVAGQRVDMYLHNFLSGHGRTDHINGNGLDNRRANLRLAVQQENNLNSRVRSDSTTGFKGVRLERRRGHWYARIKKNGQSAHLGRYPTAEDAARAYDEAARELFGQFAALNFPRSGERGAR